MDAFKRALEYTRRMWGNLNTSQRVLLGASAAALVAFLTWGSVAGAGGDMVRVVGHEVDDAARADVLKKLQEKNEKFEVRSDGIFVPREIADRVVLELAGEGIMSDRAVWQWLESSDIVASKWQLDKRYQVALQRKLEIMIRKIDGVRNASVILSPASEAQQLGFRDGAKASASVQVELRPPHAFGSKQAKGVAGLVARAVPGLETDRVHIMDTQGVPYRIPRDTGNAAATGEIRDLETRLEEEIKAKINELFPTARAVVRVVARSTDIETDKKIHTNPKVIDAEDSKRVEKVKPSGGQGGIKGEGSLVPQESSGTARDETDQSTREKSIVDVEHRRERDPAGAIQKITVGVLIPREESPENKDMTVEKAQDLILKATGEKDATSVSVMFIPSKKPEPIVPTPMGEKVTEFLSAKWATIAMVVLAFVALLLVFKAMKSAMPRGTVEEIQALTAQLTASPEIEVPQAVLSGTDNINRVKQSIQDVISRNPAGAAVGLKQWMGESQK